MEIIKVILTSLLSIGAMFVITRLIGHKQVAQLDLFDYINGITIGSIAAELATELQRPLIPLIAIAVYGGVGVLLGRLTMIFPKTRRFINGMPTVLLSGGKLYRENLKAARLDLSEFLLLCREEGYFDIDEIETAVFESNGRLSVLAKAEKRPLTPETAGLGVSGQEEIGAEVIMDGKIMIEALLRAGRDERWLKKQLRQRGFKDARRILLGIYHRKKDSLSIYTAS